MRAKRHVVILTLTLFLLLINKQSVSADVMNPEFFTKKCSVGEVEIKCRYQSKEPFGPKTYNECAKYENNQNYRYLTGSGSSFGGNSKYCFNPLEVGSPLNLVRSLFIPNSVTSLLLTLLIEIPILYFGLLRSRRILIFGIVVNLISVPIANTVTIFLPTNGILTFFAIETVVVVFEGIFLYFANKKHDRNKIFKLVFVANAISATLGSFLSMILSSYIFNF